MVKRSVLVATVILWVGVPGAGAARIRETVPERYYVTCSAAVAAVANYLSTDTEGFFNDDRTPLVCHRIRPTLVTIRTTLFGGSYMRLLIYVGNIHSGYPMQAFILSRRRRAR